MIFYFSIEDNAVNEKDVEFINLDIFLDISVIIS